VIQGCDTGWVWEWTISSVVKKDWKAFVISLPKISHTQSHTHTHTYVYISVTLIVLRLQLLNQVEILLTLAILCTWPWNRWQKGVALAPIKHVRPPSYSRVHAEACFKQRVTGKELEVVREINSRYWCGCAWIILYPQQGCETLLQGAAAISICSGAQRSAALDCATDKGF
jgi:hypothetical protein